MAAVYTRQQTEGSRVIKKNKNGNTIRSRSSTFIILAHNFCSFAEKKAVHVFFPEGLFDQVKHGRHTHASIDETWDIWPALTSGSNLHQATEWNGSAKICKSPENINARHHANWFIHIHMYYSMCSWLIYVCLEAQFIGIYWMLVVPCAVRLCGHSMLMNGLQFYDPHTKSIAISRMFIKTDAVIPHLSWPTLTNIQQILPHRINLLYHPTH